MDRFEKDLKYDVRVEVMKSQLDSFDKCARVALNLDGTIWEATDMDHAENYFDGRAQMKIGNTEKSSMQSGTVLRELRRKDLKQGACCTFHKVGLRAWTHRSLSLKHVNRNDDNHSSLNSKFYSSGSKN